MIAAPQLQPALSSGAVTSDTTYSHLTNPSLSLQLQDLDMTPTPSLSTSTHVESPHEVIPNVSSEPPGSLEVSESPHQRMVTHSQLGIHKPNPKYALTIVRQDIPRVPHSVKSALSHTGWRAAMQEEMDALHHNNTWQLVPRDRTMHVIGFKWVLKPKLKSDGTLDRLKAHVVAKGYLQLDGVDYIDTFSPLIKPGTIHLVLTIALVRQCDIR